MSIESQQLLAEATDHPDLLDEHLVQLAHVPLDVTAALVDLSDQGHLIFLDVDDLVDMLLVTLDQVLLLGENHANKFVVVTEHLLEV